MVKGNGSGILDVYCKSFLSRYTPQGQVHPTSIFRARILWAFDQRPRMNRRKVVPKAMTGSWPSMTDVFLPKIGLLQRSSESYYDSYGFQGLPGGSSKTKITYTLWQVTIGSW